MLAVVDRDALHFNDVRGDGVASPTQYVTVRNDGRRSISFAAGALSITGANGADFVVTDARLPRTLSPGKSASFGVAMNARGSTQTTAPVTARLNIVVSNGETLDVALRGLSTPGTGGNNEPSLRRIFELYEIDVQPGDSDPNTTLLDDPASSPDEDFLPRFVKAGRGNIEVVPLAEFGPGGGNTSVRFGTYEPGKRDKRDELFRVPTSSAQRVAPRVVGPTTFDPGFRAFSVYLEVPAFGDGPDGDQEARIVTSEDLFNTFEPDASERRKVRVYPNKVDGEVVPNEYLVTFEEFTDPDQNDLVLLMRNVRYAGRGAEVGLDNPDDNFADPDRLTFSRILPEGENPDFGNEVHERATLRITNSGNRPLNVSGLSVTSGGANFRLLDAPATPFRIGSGSTRNVTVEFYATGRFPNDLKTGTITITSDDRDEPTKRVALAGLFQRFSEFVPGQPNVSVEPSLQEIVDAFGLRIATEYTGQSIDTNGERSAIGDEVLSSYWEAVDENAPVVVKQLAAYHDVDFDHEVAWFTRGQQWINPNPNPDTGKVDPRFDPDRQGPRNSIFFGQSVWGQSVLPRKTNGGLAEGSFETSDVFGFRVDAEFSDNTLNLRDPDRKDEDLHHFRFYPARSADGEFLADTWVMAMDYTSINFDYNDNVFLIRNVKPAGRPASVRGVQALPTRSGADLAWVAVEGAVGYQVFRSTSVDKRFTRISGDDLVTGTSFADTGAPDRRTWYYRVVAVDADGEASSPGNAFVVKA